MDFKFTITKLSLEFQLQNLHLMKITSYYLLPIGSLERKFLFGQGAMQMKIGYFRQENPDKKEINVKQIFHSNFLHL